MNIYRYLALGSILGVCFACTQTPPLSSGRLSAPPYIPFLPLQPVSMDTMRTWEEPGQNWQLASRAYSDYQEQHDLQTEPGTGVLVNLPTEAVRENLFSSWEHGDIELIRGYTSRAGTRSSSWIVGGATLPAIRILRGFTSDGIRSVGKEKKALKGIRPALMLAGHRASGKKYMPCFGHQPSMRQAKKSNLQSLNGCTTMGCWYTKT